MTIKKFEKWKSTASSFISKITTPKREYPLIDHLIVGYVGILLLFQLFFQISPIVTFLTKTPLYSAQTYLGLLGGGLILLDLFTTKRIWQGKYSYFLYGILIVAALSSVRMISYGTKENLFKLCWAAIQFVLIYSCVFRLEREKFKKFLQIVYLSLFAIWFVSCCVSLYQYINQIGYMAVINPLSKDPSATRQGFYDNRLFGIFYTLNHAAFISLMFLVIGIFYILKTKKIWLKIVLGFAQLPVFFHLILTNSRSAHIALFACGVLVLWLLFFSFFRKRGWQQAVFPLLITIVLVFSSVVCFQLVKGGLEKVPALYLQWAEKGQEEPAPEPEPESESAPAPTPLPEEDILHRENLEEDYSNGRLRIWSDYLSLYKEIGVIGLSPSNYMGHVFEHHQDKYIVQCIKEYYPDKYEAGIVYHVHSGYMMVFVSTGFLGLLLLALFMAFCIIQLVKKIVRNEKLPLLLLGSLAIVIIGAISAVFDEGIFFQNNPHTTLFWLCLGIMMKESAKKTDIP